MIDKKALFLESMSRLGSIFVWVGMWNVIILLIGESNYLKNMICILFGSILWILTDTLENTTN
tara:strand:- start:3122 stop:3310 length:189 start_codon:yes stop_codon:yes gene_type:complete